MLCPTRNAESMPAASSRAATQSAIAGMDSRGGPSDRPCPGRSTAIALCSWRTK